MREEVSNNYHPKKAPLLVLSHMEDKKNSQPKAPINVFSVIERFIATWSSKKLAYPSFHLMDNLTRGLLALGLH